MKSFLLETTCSSKSICKRKYNPGFVDFESQEIIFLQENIPLIERSRSLLSRSTKIIPQLQKLLKL